MSETVKPRPSPHRRSRQRLFLILGGIAIVGGGLAWLASGFRANVDQQHAKVQKVHADMAAGKAFIRRTVGADLDSILKRSGFCHPSCPPAGFSGDAIQSWELQSGNAALQVLLFGDADLSTGAPRFQLLMRYASVMPDGDMAAVAHRLDQMLRGILARYHYPMDNYWPTPGNRPHGNSLYTAFSGTPTNIWYFNGHERLRGERRVSIIRTGPFDEADSWLVER